MRLVESAKIAKVKDVALHVAYIEIILDILKVDLVTRQYNLIANPPTHTHTHNVIQLGINRKTNSEKLGFSLGCQSFVFSNPFNFDC